MGQMKRYRGYSYSNGNNVAYLLFILIVLCWVVVLEFTISCNRMRGQSNPASRGRKQNALYLMDGISRDCSLLRDGNLTPGKDCTFLKDFSSPYQLPILHPAFYLEVLIPLYMKR